MKLENLLPGCKIDIRILQEIQREQQGQGEAAVYSSSLFETIDEKTLEMNAPFQAERVVLLPLNVRYELVFLTADGLFRTEGTLVDRYKRGNFYLLKVELDTEISKYQRREYYRLECHIPTLYATITEETAQLPHMKEIHKAFSGEKQVMPIRGYGTILDISGGGARLLASYDLKDYKYVLLQFTLERDSGKVNFELVGKIIRSEFNDNADKHVNRVKFLYKNTRLQEQIIGYVFEQERKVRRKEQGE